MESSRQWSIKLRGMIELLIDGVSCDVSTDSTIIMSYDVEGMMSDLDDMSEGASASVVIPSSATNDEIFVGDGEIHAPKRFNSEEHTAEVKSEGESLFVGTAYLEGVEWRDGERFYSVLVCAQRALWVVNASNNVFNEFAVELDMKLAVNRIQEQWQSDDPVRFIAVKRDVYEPTQSSVSNESIREIPALEDYHPFLNVDTMMRSIFESSGYRVQSEFMDSDYFKSLYMSGSYGSSTNSEQTVNAMDFYVRRYEDCTVEADYRGRVYMSPYYGASSVGMVVDPSTVNTESDCYSNGGCFVEYEIVPAFVPLVQVYVGFAIRLRYITPYTIADRDTLTAFNSVHLCVGHDYEFDVTNQFSDLKNELVSNFSYMLCVFWYATTDDVSIYFRMADGTQQYYGELESRVTYIVTPTEEVSALELMFNQSDGGQETYTKDWAMYNGYVQESGSTEVDVTLRITPSLITPTSPMKFDEMYIDCGVAGWEFTLLKETSISPYFYKHPGCNTSITFADIAQHDKYQISLVESMAHMYNLRFWSDEFNKVVYVEPYDDMWDRTKVWDWSDRIDWQQSVEFSDLAQEVYKTRKWGYRDGDGVTARGDGDIPADDEFGFWEAQINSTIAKDTSTESLLSPLYSPTQNNDEMLLQVGDRDDLDNVNSLDFTPRIVVHYGYMLYENAKMPYMVFYAPVSDVSLCFEDRGGVTGLNRYYQGQLGIEERGRVVSLWMKLSAFDVASLFVESGVAPNIRSLFGLNIGGDYARCILKEIVEYNPLEESVKCRFIIID